MSVTQDSSLTLKAKLFRGLADPSRLAILEALRSGEKTVTELVSVSGLSQPNVSGHLTCLKDCGLLVSRQEGRCVFYALSDARVETLIEAAEGIIGGVAERVSGCENDECQTTRKCTGRKKCASPVRLTLPARPRALTLPLLESRFSCRT